MTHGRPPANEASFAPRTAAIPGGTRVPLLFGALLLANALAWLWAWAVFARHPALLGTALLAWTFGLRHAVDADHIAAIDNVVRKLMHEGRRPVLAGTWFSLGHAAVVTLACAAIAATAAGLHGRLPILHRFGGTIGTAVSAAFLLTIGLINLVVLCRVWRHLRNPGHHDPSDPGQAAGGLLTRLFGPLFRIIGRSWHMFPLGFLFGLGFDTATEIGLLGLSATEAVHGLSPWRIMVFPALFTAGMALVDSADSVLMVRAYAWALDQPLRRLWYDLVLTAAAAVVALLIGGIEVLGLLADRLHLYPGPGAVVRALNAASTQIGVGIVLAFLLAWGLFAGWNRWRTPVMPALRMPGGQARKR